jgi:hypothetical protein
MINKKVVILVMCSSNTVYKEIEESIKETWFNLKTEDVDIIFYKDNNQVNEVIINDCDLLIPCNDGFETLGKKTLMAINWVNENYNYEYIYRSNLGAYVNPSKLLKFLDDKPKTNFYCGIIGKTENYFGLSVTFASGSGYFLSKDVVEILLRNKSLWMHHIIDDVALGDLLSKFKIYPSPLAKRLNYCDDKIYYQIGDKNVDFINENEIYHIRLRSDDRSIDIKKMKEIYENEKSDRV